MFSVKLHVYVSFSGPLYTHFWFGISGFCILVRPSHLYSLWGPLLL